MRNILRRSFPINFCGRPHLMHAAKFACAATAILFGAMALESTAAAQGFVPYHEDPTPNTGIGYNWITNCYDAPGGVSSFCPGANVGAPNRRPVPTVDPCFIAQNAMRPCKQPKAAPLPGVWGAIAIAPNLRAGYSSKNSDEKAARDAAMGLCNTVKTSGICKVIVAVPNVCVALAVSDVDHIFAVGGPIGAVDVAEDGAKLKCQRAGGRSCVIKTSFCADGVRRVLGGDTEFVNGHPIHMSHGGGLPFGRRM